MNWRGAIPCGGPTLQPISTFQAYGSLEILNFRDCQLLMGRQMLAGSLVEVVSHRSQLPQTASCAGSEREAQKTVGTFQCAVWQGHDANGAALPGPSALPVLGVRFDRAEPSGWMRAAYMLRTLKAMRNSESGGGADG